VVQFIHKDEADPDEGTGEEGSPLRRRFFASRNLDQAMRDYAPGADVVIDGLVYRSGGVTLNWKRPAGDKDARDIQSLGFIWRCPDCGAASTSHAPVSECADCGASADKLSQREFLRPAGFAADKQAAHAEADLVSYVPPEPPVVVARGASWRPLRLPEVGRLRVSPAGLVFYSSTGGVSDGGYTLCLHCGRAHAEGQPGQAPFSDHAPLRYTKADPDGKCPGASKPFAIKQRLALGHEVRTDVFELQLSGLDGLGAAWALGSALRTALTRELGVDLGEVGLAVTPRPTPLGGRVIAILLFDHASGGAGFSARASDLFARLLPTVRRLLDCQVEGCVNGCSACVLTADLRDEQDVIDRRAALAFFDDHLGSLKDPDAIDIFTPGAVFSDSTIDEIAAARGSCIVWAEFADASELRRGGFAQLATMLQRAGRSLSLVMPPETLSNLDDAARLTLRDFASRFEIDLRRGIAPSHANGAATLAAVFYHDRSECWATRGTSSRALGFDWGLPAEAPILRAELAIGDMGVPISPAELELRPEAAFLSFTSECDGPLLGFGDRAVAMITPLLEKLGAWRPDQLVRIEYYDRYLKSPLAVRLACEFLASLSRTLGKGDVLPVRLVSVPWQPDARFDDTSPWQVFHDWRADADRAAVVKSLAAQMGLDATLELRKDRHAREMKLAFADGSGVCLVFDQGFGSWRGPKDIKLRFDFAAPPETQSAHLQSLNALIEGPADPAYVVAHI
jgi:hypothetical protein